MSQYLLNFDGACEPYNPGGWMVWSWRLMRGGVNGDEIHWCSDIIKPAPRNTNNIAEWYALGFGLRSIRELKITPDPLIILGDSRLVVCQLTGEWQCRAPKLIPLKKRCLELLEGWNWDANWIPREQNEECDQAGRKKYLEAVGKPMPERHRRAS